MDPTIAAYEELYRHGLDAEFADRRRQKQPPRVNSYPPLALMEATPEHLKDLGWAAEEAERLKIKQVLMLDCELCRRHAAGDRDVGLAYTTGPGRRVHSVVHGGGMRSSLSPCLSGRGETEEKGQ